MQPIKTTRPDQGELHSPRGLRSSSSSSDIMSISGRSLVGGLPTASTRPLFVTQNAAESLTSAEIERTIVVSEPALDLVNNFLDQILYNLLALSKSTSVGALRVAIPKLLKPRLGQAALSAGEEEVRDILEESDIDPTTIPPKNKPSEFDLELVWKLARLRCMVYSSLGDMEEEDEEEVLEQENLVEEAHNPAVSTTPIEALFLAAVLGFLAEQALCNSAQHAEKRHLTQSASKQNDEDAGEDDEDSDLILEPGDMLQLGREGPLSRLWRSWRRETRSAEATTSRPASRGNAVVPTGESSHLRKASQNPKEGVIPEEDSPQSLTPSQVPLPMRDNDVDEIEVPGLAPPLDGEAEDDFVIPERSARRPSSMLLMTSENPSAPTSPTGEAITQGLTRRPQPTRTRSRSLPTPSQAPFTPHSQRKSKRDTVIFHPGDTPKINAAKDEQSDESTEEAPKAEHEQAADDAKPKRAPGSSRHSIISGTVAAIAGALGVEALKASRMNKEHQDHTFKAAEQIEQPKRTGTVAEELLGPKNNVSPPTDAETGASITGSSDFESMHIPIDTSEGHDLATPPEEQPGSDPEDLALSSADDEDARNQVHDTARDSGFAVAPPVEQEPNPTQPSPVANNPPSSPSSPKRVKREAAVYDNSMIEMRQDETDDVENPTSWPVHAGHASRASEQYRSSREVDRAPVELPVQNPGQETTYDDPGLSREQPRTEPIVTVPRTFENSRHSRGSGSSSSGKVFIYGKESGSRPAKLSQQRATFGEALQGGPVKEHNPPAGTLASRRGRLRLSTDEDTRTIEDKKKSLEILIQSDETLHYTLTPESARATQFSPSDIRAKTQTQDLADFIRNTAPPGDQPVQQPPKISTNGLRSNPTATAAAVPQSVTVAPIPRPVSQAGPQRNVIGAPRDARPERNTTRDLADYVRSTGPANEHQLAQALGTRPSTARSVARQGVGGVRADGVPVAPAANVSLDTARSAETPERSANRLKFQARDARPSRNTETAELIDFIREGPPRAAGEHRIDRLVAPFRTTMDSDDLNALAPPPDVNGRGSVGSQPESAATAKSVQESTNSRTALLESTNRVNGANAVGNGIMRKPISESNGMPTRVRRKARDPYAIDDSDDELFEEEYVRPKPKAQEESLVDFLRNTAPPPGMSPQPILSAVPKSQEKPEIKRQTSTSKLKDVLNRQTSMASRASTPKANGARGARERSPHLTQVGSKRDIYRPTQTTHAAHVDRNRQNRRKESRDPTSGNGSTSELAAYLKNSGPPEAAQPPRYSPTKDQAGFLKFFSRRGSVKR